MTTPEELLHYYAAAKAREQVSLVQFLDEAAREYLRVSLVRAGNNQCLAAEKLGMHRNTIHRHLARLNLPLEGRVKQRKVVGTETIVSKGEDDAYDRMKQQELDDPPQESQ